MTSESWFLPKVCLNSFCVDFLSSFSLVLAETELLLTWSRVFFCDLIFFSFKLIRSGVWLIDLFRCRGGCSVLTLLLILLSDLQTILPPFIICEGPILLTRWQGLGFDDLEDFLAVALLLDEALRIDRVLSRSSTLCFTLCTNLFLVFGDFLKDLRKKSRIC